jgi:hypothetical protein
MSTLGPLFLLAVGGEFFYGFYQKMASSLLNTSIQSSRQEQWHKMVVILTAMRRYTKEKYPPRAMLN